MTVLRALPAMAILLVLAAPYWVHQIDDQFITLAFAWEWVETGRIAWSTGEVVEGFSSFTHLLLGAAAIAAGADPNLFVKRLALASGLAILLLGALRLPPRGGILLLAIAAWQPMAAWSGLGLEMTLFTFLVSLAWVEVVRPTRAWIAPIALLVAAFTRPEGNGHLVAGLAARALLARRMDGWALGSAAGWLGLHGWRVATFGHVLPTPFLVKVQTPFDAQDSLVRLAEDLFSGAGLIAATLVLFPSGSRTRLVAVLPVAIQSGLALGSAVDWMGNGRFLLPGLVAGVLTWAAGSTSTARRALALLLGLAGGLVRPVTELEHGMKLRTFSLDPSPILLYRSAFDTPCFGDLAWMVPEAPAGSDVFTADVGMPGNISAIALHDLGGLTDRQVAEYAASPSPAGEAALLARFEGRTPMRVRIVNYHGGGLGAWPTWLRGAWTGPRRIDFPEGAIGVYSTDPDLPPADVVIARWRSLHLRYPSQGPLIWAYAQALATTDLVAATVLVDEARARYPVDPILAALPSALWDRRGPDAWKAPDVRGAQTQGPFPHLDLSLAVTLTPDRGERCRVTARWACSDERTEVWTEDVSMLAIPPLTCAPTALLHVELSKPCQESGIGVVVGVTRATPPTNARTPE